MAATVSSSSALSCSPSVCSATADVVGLGEAQRVVDERRVGAVVLVDLEPARPGVEERLERPVVLGAGAGLEADVERPVGGRGERPGHRRRRLLEAGRDQRGDATGQRGRQQLRRDEVDVAVDRPGRGDQAVAHDRLGVRADRQLDPVADRVVAGPPDADDAAVLDPDVGLDHAEHRVQDEGAGHDRVELGGPGRPWVAPGRRVLA